MDGTEDDWIQERVDDPSSGDKPNLSSDNDEDIYAGILNLVGFLLFFQVNKLVQLGGRNPNAAVKHMLIYLFVEDKLAAEYSWHGKKGKRKFSDLRLCQHLFSMCHLLCTAVRRHFPQSTRDDVESTTKSWLHHAPERANG
ncbi:uncharacterized protein [Dermacentor albipictus]|uniref:uncharacterized protein n=1 Tax=Dermacentor albipictus TaxID=60249 RepID=UPI0038FC9E1A